MNDQGFERIVLRHSVGEHLFGIGAAALMVIVCVIAMTKSWIVGIGIPFFGAVMIWLIYVAITGKGSVTLDSSGVKISSYNYGEKDQLIPWSEIDHIQITELNGGKLKMITFDIKDAKNNKKGPIPAISTNYVGYSPETLLMLLQRYHKQFGYSELI